MTQIMNASDLKELSILGEAEFEKNVLEGPRFKSIMTSIEDAAMQGHCSWGTSLVPAEEVRELRVIQQALQDAGYNCELDETTGKAFGILDYTNRKFEVSW